MTQAVSSPYLGGRALGLAKIRKDLKEPGTRVDARIGVDLVAGEPSQVAEQIRGNSRRRLTAASNFPGAIVTKRGQR